MADSDETFCSDAESKDPVPVRRSKRLSQRCLFNSFRSNVDLSLQRLLEIHQTLKRGELCSNWTIFDWQAQKLEVESIQEILNGEETHRISIILKKINKNLKNLSSAKEQSYALAFIQPNQNNDDKQEQSPNILAGMMTEALTEIPPHQPDDLALTKNHANNPGQPSVGLTQKNPLDLTRRVTGASVILDGTVTQSEFSAALTQNQAKISTPLPKVHNKENIPPLNKDLFISLDPLIDLTDERVEVKKSKSRARNARKKTAELVSKWVENFPSEIFIDPTKCTHNANAHKRKPSSLQESIIKLYKDPPTATTTSSNKNQKLLARSSSSKNPKTRQSEEKSKLHRRTEGFVRHNQDVAPEKYPRNAQSEHFSDLSPSCVLDELLELDDDNESFVSFRHNFREIFGTDNLSDVFGCDEVVYNLQENHVRKLAAALKVDYQKLKQTIEDILSDDKCQVNEILCSDSSVIECSQSPPQQRRLLSQKSQISK